MEISSIMTTFISLSAGHSGLDGSSPDSNPLDSYMKRCNVTQPMLPAAVAIVSVTATRCPMEQNAWTRKRAT